jgi:hypothetical protein
MMMTIADSAALVITAGGLVGPQSAITDSMARFVNRDDHADARQRRCGIQARVGVGMRLGAVGPPAPLCPGWEPPSGGITRPEERR